MMFTLPIEIHPFAVREVMFKVIVLVLILHCTSAILLMQRTFLYHKAHYHWLSVFLSSSWCTELGFKVHILHGSKSQDHLHSFSFGSTFWGMFTRRVTTMNCVFFFWELHKTVVFQTVAGLNLPWGAEPLHACMSRLFKLDTNHQVYHLSSQVS